MKFKILAPLVLIIAFGIFVFYRQEQVRKAELFLNTPDEAMNARRKDLLIGFYRIMPNSIPLERGRLDILRCWAEYEVNVPFWSLSTDYEKTGRVRLVLEVTDGASNYGVEERLKFDHEYAKQRFIQGNLEHRMAWKIYDGKVPTEFILERRSGDLNINLKMHLTKIQ